MGEKSERVDSVVFSPLDKHWKIFAAQKPDPLIPAPAYNPQEQRRRSPIEQEPLWNFFVSWAKYHSIQMRWDIERALARLFHQRWGG